MLQEWEDMVASSAPSCVVLDPGHQETFCLSQRLNTFSSEVVL